MAITYKLLDNIPTPDGEIECEYVLRIDSETTEGNVMVHKTGNEEYVKWIAEGNTPDPFE